MRKKKRGRFFVNANPARAGHRSWHKKGAHHGPIGGAVFVLVRCLVLDGPAIEFSGFCVYKRGCRVVAPIQPEAAHTPRGSSKVLVMDVWM